MLTAARIPGTGVLTSDGASVDAVAYSPDGKILATGSSHGISYPRFRFNLGWWSARVALELARLIGGRVVRAVWLLIVAVFVLAASACTGGAVAGQSSSQTSAIGSAGRTVKEAQSPPASGFASIDWPVFARNFFGCGAPSGEDWDVFLPSIRYADADGDGIPDAVVVGACPTTTSSNPAMVVVFSGASPSASPAEIGHMPGNAQDDDFASLSVSVKPGTITLDGEGYSATAHSCCPDEDITLTYQWRHGGFSQTGRVVKNMSGG
jgi:hypothetical protein